MKIKRRSIIAFCSGLAVSLVVGCTNQTQAPTGEAGADNATGSAANAGEINLYSARHYDTDDALYTNFTEETGIKVNLIESDADELIEKIKSEGANSPADVLITVDAGRLWRAQEEGLLQPISSEKLEAAIPANLRDPQGNWFGLSKRARVIVYNPENVKPEELTSYEALTEPEWKGRVCIRSSENIYNQSLVASKIESKGAEETENWVKGLVANFARPPEGNDTAQIKAVAAGQCDVAIVNHYYVARVKQSEEAEDQEVASNIAVLFPNQNEEGTHVNISGGGVVANAPNKENAVKFLEYLVTPEAQEIFANQANEYPVVANIKPNSEVASFGEFKESDVNVLSYGKNNPDAVKLMDRAGWK
ncbi:MULTISPECIES: Fe(3+) ABC transporter substrate-binding protein [unclassified Coleofasciculus]|uniref:Fe(3+) ABC transporter substrate-binding protein n=1 Tax=unclassified Coleofasciculus TaxID=2692782 RepID=UPI0018808805|nr:MULTISPECIES: Fe(3+) ABC transporter substrate-binding protein [unclassified Coleofasciculus]MBE9129624.1 Fe(3+) ABC transporter substrate-binding protein [Coleofasciculus sp. LEGE 07081]MBE9149804.1 Fe(3+) ABC transporter substrate-binding protein [Coleofasciculus sp. LEGE 07092]